MRHPVVAVLLALTALAVIVPVTVQVAGKRYPLRQAWAHLMIAMGMLGVAVAYGLLEGKVQGILAVAGFLVALLGMVAVQRRG